MSLAPAAETIYAVKEMVGQTATAVPNSMQAYMDGSIQNLAQIPLQTQALACLS